MLPEGIPGIPPVRRSAFWGGGLVAAVQRHCEGHAHPHLLLAHDLLAEMLHQSRVVEGDELGWRDHHRLQAQVTRPFELLRQ